MRPIPSRLVKAKGIKKPTKNSATPKATAMARMATTLPMKSRATVGIRSTGTESWLSRLPRFPSPTQTRKLLKTTQQPKRQEAARHSALKTMTTLWHPPRCSNPLSSSRCRIGIRVRRAKRGLHPSEQPQITQTLPVSLKTSSATKFANLKRRSRCSRLSSLSKDRKSRTLERLTDNRKNL